MPHVDELVRAYRHPRGVREYQPANVRDIGIGFRPGAIFDLYDAASNRLGWARVLGSGDIELFDAASNRFGLLRPTFRAFVAHGNGHKTYQQPLEALKKGEVLVIGPEGKRGVWRDIGGNPVFVEVQQGESVPKAIKRVERARGRREQAPRGQVQEALRSPVAGKDRSWVDAKGQPITDEATLLRIKTLAIPPAWTDVQVSVDPKAQLQVTGVDIKGRKQYRYSAEFTGRQAAAKFQRVTQVAKAYPRLLDGISRDLVRGKMQEAVVAALITQASMRMGSPGEARGDVKAYGASTLEPRHVTVRGDTVAFNFPGKKGVQWTGEVQDPVLAKAVAWALKGKRTNQPLFGVDAKAVNRYFRRFGQFSAKDIRTLHGTALARQQLAGEPPPKTKREARALVRRVAVAVATQLRNTPAVAKSNYINPIVWAPLESEFGITVLKRKAA